MKLMLMKTSDGVLVPATEHDQDTYEKLRRNTHYKADLRKARNPDHHRKGFALINLIFENQEQYKTLEDLLVELKLRAGWYTEHVRNVNSPILDSLAQFAYVCPGQIRKKLERYVEVLRARDSVVFVPKSISFADMDQLEFEQFYERVIDIAVEHYGLREALEFAGIKVDEQDFQVPEGMHEQGCG